MGFADSPATRTALAGAGIRVSGYRWQWGLGLKGGTFPPHLDINGEHAPTSDSFEALPGEDVNGDTCMCQLVPVYRDEAGRFAKPGLEPVFTPPVIASLEPYRPEPIDWSPLVAALTEQREFTLTVPEGAFTINLPELSPTFHVAAPNVTVAAAAAPEVTVQPTFQVESPNVNVAPPTVNVAAPNVTVSPNIEVKPAPVKIIREKVARAVRFRRNANGQIEEAEVTSE